VPLVDRDKFPSDTISTHALAFNAVDSLRRLGVLLRIEAAGFRRIFRHRAWVEDICIEAPAALRPLFEQTVAAAAARDDSSRQLDPLRAVLLNQHDARRVIRALPGLLDQMFEPMDRFRHGFIANLYEAEGEARA